MNKWPVKIPDEQMSRILQQMSDISAAQAFWNQKVLGPMRDKHYSEMKK